MNRLHSDQAKLRAVAEVIGGQNSLTNSAHKHGISVSYLSILVSRARASVLQQEKRRRSKFEQTDVPIENQILALERGLSRLLKTVSNIKINILE